MRRQKNKPPSPILATFWTPGCPATCWICTSRFHHAPLATQKLVLHWSRNEHGLSMPAKNTPTASGLRNTPARNSKPQHVLPPNASTRSEEHTSELQS